MSIPPTPGPPTPGPPGPQSAPGIPPAGSLRCPRCSATVGPDQDWCLECGAPARTRLAPTPNWQLPTVALGAVFLIAGALFAFAFVKLTEDGGAPAAPAAVTTTPAPVVAPPVVPPVVPPPVGATATQPPGTGTTATTATTGTTATNPTTATTATNPTTGTTTQAPSGGTSPTNTATTNTTATTTNPPAKTVP